MAEIQHGEWYLGVYCSKCQWPIPLLRDPSQGKADKAGGPGKLRVTCPRPDCRHEADYGTDNMVSLRVQSNGLTSRMTPPEPRSYSSLRGVLRASGAGATNCSPIRSGIWSLQRS